MTKENIKNWVKTHKTELITGTIAVVGTAALTLIGVNVSKRKYVENWNETNREFIDFLHTVDEACEGCDHYVPLTLGEVAAAIDKDGIVRDCLRDPNGDLFEVRKLIAFGNKVEP